MYRAGCFFLPSDKKVPGLEDSMACTWFFILELYIHSSFNLVEISPPMHRWHVRVLYAIFFHMHKFGVLIFIWVGLSIFCIYILVVTHEDLGMDLGCWLSGSKDHHELMVE